MVRRSENPECAVRELNPGYELGKLMSYHWTNGALCELTYRVPPLDRCASEWTNVQRFPLQGRH